MRFVTTITIQATPQQIWQAMFNPYLLSQCLPGLAEWQELEPQRSYHLLLVWSATAEGPTIQAPLLIQWGEATPHEQIGWDAELFLGSQGLPMTGTIVLAANGTGTVVTLEAQIELPSPVLRQMANQVALKILQPFFTCLRACLEETAVHEQ